MALFIEQSRTFILQTLHAQLLKSAFKKVGLERLDFENLHTKYFSGDGFENLIR